MEIDLNKIQPLSKFIIPHIGLTTFKYRGKASSILKKAKADITIDQFIILKLLSLYGSLTQQETAEILYKDKSNLSRMIDALEEKGYISRLVDVKNKRIVKVLNITEKGLIYAEKATLIAEKLHNSAMQGITDEEKETIKRVMKKIRDNLDKEIEVCEL